MSRLNSFKSKLIQSNVLFDEFIEDESSTSSRFGSSELVGASIGQVARQRTSPGREVLQVRFGPLRLIHGHIVNKNVARVGVVADHVGNDLKRASSFLTRTFGEHVRSKGRRILNEGNDHVEEHKLTNILRSVEHESIAEQPERAGAGGERLGDNLENGIGQLLSSQKHLFTVEASLGERINDLGGIGLEEGVLGDDGEDKIGESRSKPNGRTVVESEGREELLRKARMKELISRRGTLLLDASTGNKSDLFEAISEGGQLLSNASLDGSRIVGNLLENKESL